MTCRSISGRSDLPGQMELPQTDPRPAELAKRNITSRLLAKAPQKPCDIGLFGDDAAQTDLLDLAKR